MKNLALPRIQKMNPYSPPLEGRANYKGLLLDFNERTEPSIAATKALSQLVEAQKLQVYPEYTDLTDKIAAYAGVKPSQVMFTNGTDQAIDVIFRTFIDKDELVVIPSPTFAMYDQYARVGGNQTLEPLYSGTNLEFPLSEVLESVAKNPKLIVVCNPNSPTGTLLPIESIKEIATKAQDSIIYVDEAYFEFSKQTAVGLLADCPNVMVSRTFSKAFGLASVRLGYVMANEVYITEMLKVRGPYDINMAAYYSAMAGLDDLLGMERYCSEVMEQAKPFTEQFFTENNIDFFPSSGNFILFKPNNWTRVFKTLEQNGVMVRAQNKVNIEGSLRLTIGTLAQMQEFTRIYQEVILS